MAALDGINRTGVLFGPRRSGHDKGTPHRAERMSYFFIHSEENARESLGAQGAVAKVLVVEERATDREFLQTLLGFVGHTVYGAADGEEGLRLAHDRQPDLAIVDVVMPTMDGLEFVKRLRSSPKMADVPVIFYSASFLRTEAEKLALSGRVARVIQKPAEPEEIL